MSQKIEVALAVEAIKKVGVTPEVLRKIIEEMNLIIQAEEEGEEKVPAQKKQWTVLVSDPEGIMPKADLVAWICQLPADDSPATLQDRIFRAAYDYNASKKGRLFPAKKVGDALENVPAKFFKETECWIKTREPVLVLRTNNVIPQEPVQ